MIVYVEDASCFADPGTWESLSALLRRVAARQHRLIVGNPKALTSSAFFEQMAPPRHRAEWVELVERSVADGYAQDPTLEPGARPGARHAEVSIRGSGRAEARWSLPPSGVGRWAERPLRMLLENDNDRHFVAFAASVFGAHAILHAIEMEWLVFDQRGGVTEVTAAVRSLSREERAFAFADSDREAEGARPHPNSQNLSSACERGDVPYHLTAWRELDNYLPIPHLSATIDANPPSQTRTRHSRNAQTYAALPPKSRRYVDLPAHLSGAAHNTRQYRTAKQWLRIALSKLRDADASIAASWDEDTGRELRDELLAELNQWL